MVFSNTGGKVCNILELHEANRWTSAMLDILGAARLFECRTSLSMSISTNFPLPSWDVPHAEHSEIVVEHLSVPINTCRMYAVPRELTVVWALANPRHPLPLYRCGTTLRMPFTTRWPNVQPVNKCRLGTRMNAAESKQAPSKFGADIALLTWTIKTPSESRCAIAPSPTQRNASGIHFATCSLFRFIQNRQLSTHHASAWV